MNATALATETQSLSGKTPSSVRLRLPELDGIRGIALLSVFLYHYAAVQVTPHTLAYYLMIPRGLMWSGVDLFFVLSGFLIGGILMDHRESARYYGTFYMRRIHRIFPLYYALGLVLIVGTAFWPTHHLFTSKLPAWPYLLFAQSFAMPLAMTFGPQISAVTWSLAIEEQFYLLFPFAVRRMTRRALTGLTIGCIVGAPLLRIALIFGAGWKFEQVHPLLPCRADALAFGVLAAILVRSEHARDWISRHRAIAYGCLLLLSASCITLLKWANYNYVGTAGYSLLAATYFLFLLLLMVTPLPSVKSILCWGWLRWLGTISYCVYLVHEPVRYSLFGWAGIGEPAITGFPTLALTLAATAITLGIAQLSWILIERRLIRRAQVRHSY